MIWTYKNINGNVLLEMKKRIDINKKTKNHFFLDELKKINNCLMIIVILMLVCLVGCIFLSFKQ